MPSKNCGTSINNLTEDSRSRAPDKDSIQKDVMPNKNADTVAVTTKTPTENIVPQNDPVMPSASTGVTMSKNTVTPYNAYENIEDSVDLPDLGTNQPEIKPIASTAIDLPNEVVDEVTLPEFGDDNLTTDFLGDDVDNSALISVDAALATDFTKEMALAEGVDRDLKLELENLTFLEEQTKGQKKKRDENKPKQPPKSEKSKGMMNKPMNVMPKNTAVSATNNSTSQASPRPSSPKGTWKTTKHGIRKKYGPSHLQNYGCKVCGQLLPSKGKLNEHYRMNHPPVLCPVCQKIIQLPQHQGLPSLLA